MYMDAITHVKVKEAKLALLSKSSGLNQCFKSSVEYQFKYSLAQLLNLSLRKGFLPKSLKTAKIVPIHRRGSVEEIENYSSISILSSFSKIIEQIVQTKLWNFFNKYNVIASEQHGFCKNNSTNIAAYEVWNYVYTSLCKKIYTVALFFDMPRALDYVKSEYNIEQLKVVVIRGNVADWMYSFLRVRKVFATISEVLSDKQQLKVGLHRVVFFGLCYLFCLWMT